MNRIIKLSALYVFVGLWTTAGWGGEPDVPTESFNIRDPYVLTFPEEKVYRLYEAKPWAGGDGVNVRLSRDLKTWSQPKPALRLAEPLKSQVKAYWAPEVHAYKGKYYLFVTLTFEKNRRGTWIFRSDSPDGPFAPMADRAVTPADWMCLDGTLWVEDGKPYIVFCHEWIQAGDGRMMLAPLRDDLSGLAGEPQELFRASDHAGKPLKLDEQKRHLDRVTDGPFLYRSPKGGRLFMVWSNVVTGNGYVDILCESASGKVAGPWVKHRFLFDRDGGHGMLFRTLEGQLMLTLHQPNNAPLERMRHFPIDDDGLTLRLRAPVDGAEFVRAELPELAVATDTVKVRSTWRLADAKTAAACAPTWHLVNDAGKVCWSVTDTNAFARAAKDGATEVTVESPLTFDCREEVPENRRECREKDKPLRWIVKPGVFTVAVSLGPDAPRRTVGEIVVVDDWWVPRFESKRQHVAALKGKTLDAVMLGDSITHFWELKCPNEWNDFSKGRAILNLGFASDRIAHVAWRIRKGMLDGYTARNVVLMIGTNNASDRADPATIAKGVEDLVALVRSKQPQAKVILHPVFPRGNSPKSEKHAPARRINDEVNGLLEEFVRRDGKIAWVDFSRRLVDASGWVPQSIMADECHPTAAGFAIWRDELEKALAEPKLRATVKVLAIGNSFSESLLTEFAPVTRAAGVGLDFTSLYIGGCSLKQHAENLKRDGDKSYTPYRLDRLVLGIKEKPRYVNVGEVLRGREKYDIVTVQQASPYSWRPDTYTPYGDELIAAIRTYQPQAKIHVQETWSYTPWCKYLDGQTPDEMYAKLHAAYAAFAAQRKLPVIPTGTAVQEWRRRLPVKYTDRSFGGDLVGGRGMKSEQMFVKDAQGKFCPADKCDTSHLNEAGEYFQALVWTADLFGVDVCTFAYKPACVSLAEAELMKKVVMDVVHPAGQTTVVEPKNTDEILQNPGMGIVHFHYSSRLWAYGADLEPGDTLEWMPGTSVIYMRLPWCYLEPREGEYRWDILESKTRPWIKAGKKVAFRISCMDPTLDSTPKWAIDKGIKGRRCHYHDKPENALIFEPEWDDPILLETYGNFLKAFARRYDGNADVAFVDLGSFGLYGEGHSSRLHEIRGRDPEEFNRLCKLQLDLLRKRLPNTYLVVSDDVGGGGWLKDKDGRQLAEHPLFVYARSLGYGLRDDSIMCNPQHPWASAHFGRTFAKETPVVIETGHMVRRLSKNVWYPEKLRACIEDYHASYISTHGFPDQYWQVNKGVWKDFANRLGYRFELRRAEWPNVVRVSEPVRVKSTWVNVGVAPQYGDASLTWSLLNEKGAVCWSVTDPSFGFRSLEPKLDGVEKPKTVESPCTFGYAARLPDNGNDVILAYCRQNNVHVPPSTVQLLKPGTYTLAVSVGRADGTPRVALPLENGRDRVYPLGTIEVRP